MRVKLASLKKPKGGVYVKKRNIRMLEDGYKHSRDYYKDIEDFFQKRRTDVSYKDKILIIYGLQHTGKTTLVEQYISHMSEDELKRCAFYVLDNGDTMDDVENIIEKEQRNGVHTIFLDEITKVQGFAEESSSLANVYAKENMTIVLSGTDSLGFYFAAHNDLMGKCIRLGTTHIPFSEYCDVLEINDMDVYIRYGGLMPDGTTSHFVSDYQDAKDYVRDSVANNIANSLKRNPGNSILDSIKKEDIAAIIDKLVEKWSGKFDTYAVQEKLKKSSVTFVNNVLTNGELPLDPEYIHIMGREKTKKDIAKDFLPIVNADKEGPAVDDNIVNELAALMSDMGVLSTTRLHTYTYTSAGVWGNKVESNEYYIVQPAIKYYHLTKAREFVLKSDWYQDIPEEWKTYLNSRLTDQIFGLMLEQIVVFDTDCDLKDEKITDGHGLEKRRYDVCKTKFKVTEGKELVDKEYDMLIRDNNTNEYYGFEIKHTTVPGYEQAQHLRDELIRQVVDKNYGSRKNVAVLYRGAPFQCPDGIIYLNVSDFLLSIHRTKDIKKTMEELTTGLPTRDLKEQDEFDNREHEDSDPDSDDWTGRGE